jgi:hypothetical protein
LGERSARNKYWKKIEGAFDLLAKSTQAGGTAGESFTGSNISLANCTLGGLRYMSTDKAWIKVSVWNDGKWIYYMAALEEWTAVDYLIDRRQCFLVSFQL